MKKRRRNKSTEKRKKRSKTPNEVKSVENLNKNPQSFQGTSHVQMEVASSYRQRD